MADEYSSNLPWFEYTPLADTQQQGFGQLRRPFKSPRLEQGYKSPYAERNPQTPFSNAQEDIENLVNTGSTLLSLPLLRTREAIEGQPVFRETDLPEFGKAIEGMASYAWNEFLNPVQEAVSKQPHLGRDEWSPEIVPEAGAAVADYAAQMWDKFLKAPVDVGLMAGGPALMNKIAKQRWIQKGAAKVAAKSPDIQRKIGALPDALARFLPKELQDYHPASTFSNALVDEILKNDAAGMEKVAQLRKDLKQAIGQLPEHMQDKTLRAWMEHTDPRIRRMLMEDHVLKGTVSSLEHIERQFLKAGDYVAQAFDVSPETQTFTAYVPEILASEARRAIRTLRQLAPQLQKSKDIKQMMKRLMPLAKKAKKMGVPLTALTEAQEIIKQTAEYSPLLKKYLDAAKAVTAKTVKETPALMKKLQARAAKDAAAGKRRAYVPLVTKSEAYQTYHGTRLPTMGKFDVEGEMEQALKYMKEHNLKSLSQVPEEMRPGPARERHATHASRQGEPSIHTMWMKIIGREPITSNNKIWGITQSKHAAKPLDAMVTRVIQATRWNNLRKIGEFLASQSEEDKAIMLQRGWVNYDLGNALAHAANVIGADELHGLSRKALEGNVFENESLFNLDRMAAKGGMNADQIARIAKEVADAPSISNIVVPKQMVKMLNDIFIGKPRENQGYKILKKFNSFYSEMLFGRNPAFGPLMGVRTAGIMATTIRNPKDLVALILGKVLAHHPDAKKVIPNELMLSHGSGAFDPNIIRAAQKWERQVAWNEALFATKQGNDFKALWKGMKTAAMNAWALDRAALDFNSWVVYENPLFGHNPARRQAMLAHILYQVQDKPPSLRAMIADFFDLNAAIQRAENLTYSTAKDINGETILQKTQKFMTGTYGNYSEEMYRNHIMEMMRIGVPLAPWVMHAKSMIEYMPIHYPQKMRILVMLQQMQQQFQTAEDFFGHKHLPIKDENGKPQYDEQGRPKYFYPFDYLPITGGLELVSDAIELMNQTKAEITEGGDQSERHRYRIPAVVSPLLTVPIGQMSPIDPLTNRPWADENPDLEKRRQGGRMMYVNRKGKEVKEPGAPFILWDIASKLSPYWWRKLQGQMTREGERWGVPSKFTSPVNPAILRKRGAKVYETDKERFFKAIELGAHGQ